MELPLLWSEVDAYDACNHEGFYLQAALLWTIIDFLAYVVLSGSCTKSYKSSNTSNQNEDFERAN